MPAAPDARQDVERARHERPNAGLRDAHDRADVGVRQVTLIPQQERLPLSLREHAGESIEPEPELRLPLARVGARVAAQPESDPRQAPGSPPTVSENLPGGEEQPRERWFRHHVPRPQRPFERFGCDLFGIRRGARQSQHVAIDVAVVECVDRLEGALGGWSRRLYGHDEFPLARRLGGGHPGWHHEFHY
jgi:hypothetical protein